MDPSIPRFLSDHVIISLPRFPGSRHKPHPITIRLLHSQIIHPNPTEQTRTLKHKSHYGYTPQSTDPAQRHAAHAAQPDPIQAPYVNDRRAQPSPAQCSLAPRPSCRCAMPRPNPDPCECPGGYLNHTQSEAKERPKKEKRKHPDNEPQKDAKRKSTCQVGGCVFYVLLTLRISDCAVRRATRVTRVSASVRMVSSMASVSSSSCIWSPPPMLLPMTMTLGTVRRPVVSARTSWSLRPRGCSSSSTT